MAASSKSKRHDNGHAVLLPAQSIIGALWPTRAQSSFNLLADPDSESSITVNFVVAIPARYGSQRLLGKPLIPIAGTPLVVHVAHRALAAGADEVVVATDDPRIAEVLVGMGVGVVMTRDDHASGSDRLAECAALRGWSDDTIVVNLQGDEPLAPVSGIRAVAQTLANGDAAMATLAVPLHDSAELFDPNVVKLVRDVRGNALSSAVRPCLGRVMRSCQTAISCRKTSPSFATSASTPIVPASLHNSRSSRARRWKWLNHWSNFGRWRMAMR